MNTSFESIIVMVAISIVVTLIMLAIFVEGAF